MDEMDGWRILRALVMGMITAYDGLIHDATVLSR